MAGRMETLTGLTKEKLFAAERIVVKDLLGALRLLGGYYECPKDASGKRLRPLVGYAGRDSQGRQKVGDIYANMAILEEWPRLIGLPIKESGVFDELVLCEPTVVCAAPLGGMTVGPCLAGILGVRYIYAEKKVIELATDHSREKSKLVFARHEPKPGDRVVIVEDVCNNFSTTEELVRLILQCGAEVVRIFCLLDRSLGSLHQTIFETKAGQPIIVNAIVRKPIPEYEQDDPEVAADIEAGNVVWKAKDEWPRLMADMSDHTR